jgi:hypothetical protein
LTFVDRAIPAWTFTNRNGNCALPNSLNPCLRPDQRITSGWLAKGVIGFFWNVKEGGGFAFPYVESATFRQSDQAYLGRPYIWNGSFAFQYGASAPNDRGHLGIECHMLGGTVGYPQIVIGADDDYNGVPPGWEIYSAGTSTIWGSNSMGDYLRVRVHQPGGTFWTSSAFVTKTVSSGISVLPRYIVFGRSRDTNAFNRWFNK